MISNLELSTDPNHMRNTKDVYRQATSQKLYLPPKEEKKSKMRNTEMPRYRGSNTKVSVRKSFMTTKVEETHRAIMNKWINKV